ncbi:hypothetical protein C4D60_Mb06t33510 [Musa balbisiana]|uniref:Uncharacterized protein n=1 Tax=Musa balbisiana TaxID=52838 RepID=A0A4S8ISN0_MUSBA|nr:hypothetical protein C4D60_Mb06t33510 [Musa balbisiana]
MTPSLEKSGRLSRSLDPPDFISGSQRQEPFQEDSVDTQVLHLSIAELDGDSFVAVFAYYVRCKTLIQLLDFAQREGTRTGRGGGAW